MVKIEAGKFYRTIDGRRVGPMVRHRGGWVGRHRADTDTSFDWYDDGSYSPLSKTHPLTIVAEWADDASPIRTVMRQEILPGVYGRVRVNENDDGTGIESIDMMKTTEADDLRKAARVLVQLADFMEGK